MSREKQIELIMEDNPNAIFVASTGKISRELYELRLKRGEEPNDFYMMGSMGHAPDIAVGIAMATDKQIVVLNGDGAAAMRLGSGINCDTYPNIYHYILDNGVYESTGGQQTVFKRIKKAFSKTSAIIFNVDIDTREDLGRVGLQPSQIIQNVYAKIHS